MASLGNKVRMNEGLSSRALNRVPGDKARVLTAPATDETGRAWPVGTVYQSLCGGSDGIGRYAEVTIEMTRVTFRFPW